MKKTNILFQLIVLFISSQFIISCSSIEHSGLTKRLYTKGYYIEGLSSVNKKQSEKAITKTNTTTVNEDQNLSASIDNSSPVIAKKPLIKIENNRNEASAPSTTSINGDRLNKKQIKKLVKAIKQQELSEAVQPPSSIKEEIPKEALIALCILIPPLAVYFMVGINEEFWISLILSCLFWIPGIIYAFYIFSKNN